MKDNYSHQPHGHPVFDDGGRHRVGRINLPVAPRCNIKCNYCSRKHDCVNENQPGVTTKVISPEAARERVAAAIRAKPGIEVVGITGPGDALANEATFATMEMLRREFPQLSLCLSTNGLLLPERINDLADVGLELLTVTVNTMNEHTGAGIYEYVLYRERVLTGVEGAAALRDSQLKGIRRAVDLGIRVKVNTVLLPGMNEPEMITLARTMRDLGVSLMNIMPLIPQDKFAHLEPVPELLYRKIRQTCGRYVDQSHCRQWRADAAGLLGRDLVLV